jgi:hypothetical protein
VHRFILEIHTPTPLPEVLDHFKANGGHANLINVRPDLPDHKVPAYVGEPYPPEAYELIERPQEELPPDCPYCDGTGNLSAAEDLAAAVHDRHPDWDDDAVEAEVTRVQAELDAQEDRHERNRQRIAAHVKVRKAHPDWSEDRVAAEVERILAKG